MIHLGDCMVQLLTLLLGWLKPFGAFGSVVNLSSVLGGMRA